MALRSIKTERRRLADQAYDRLVEAILNQDIRKDDRLVQERLAAELEISRTPVREALIRLEKEGVLEVVAGGGFRLARMSEAEVRQLYQARMAIEGQAAQILAAQGAAAEFDRLRALIRKAEDLSSPTTRDYFAANRNIHRAFVVLAENRFLLELFDMIWGKAMAFHLFAAIENVDLRQSLGNHLSLVDALESGDGGRALAEFDAHISEGLDLQIAGLRRQQV